MMTRYKTNRNIKTSYDGKKFFGTRTYPNISPREDDIIYITNDGDYLDSLAYRFYKDSSLWWVIALVNNIGTGRLGVEGGLQIRIPINVDTVLNEYNRLN
jgi:phage tail protein X